MKPILEKVKAALRVKTAAFDEEIAGVIAACEADIRLVGITVLTLPPLEPAGDIEEADNTEPIYDPLIERAIILYSKANFGYSEESEKYQKAYDLLKCSLSLAGDYHALV